MAKRIKCPDKKWFEKLADGSVNQEQEAQLTAHLDQCESCRESMDQLNDIGDLLGDTVNKSNPTIANESESFRERLAEIKSKEPTAQSSFAARGYMDVMPWIDESENHVGRIDEFELIEFVGRGGMGIVFKALDEKLQRFVALKLMSPQMLVDEAAKARFLREARSAAGISHTNVVTVHTVNETRGLPYLVMEYVEGDSLETRLQSETHLPIRQIVAISTQMTRGLNAAHSKGVLHRDIKPANIMLERQTGQVKITDFGLACMMEGSKLTRTGMLVGTPDFISPEQANSQPADERSDLFSLGCVIYAMCSGKSPFSGPTMMSTLDNVRSREPESLSKINTGIPGWMIGLVDRLLKKEPSQRFASTEEVLRQFENADTATELPFVDTRTSSQVATHIRDRQNSFLRSLLLLAASVTLAVSTIFWWIYTSKQNETERSNQVVAEMTGASSDDSDVGNELGRVEEDDENDEPDGENEFFADSEESIREALESEFDDVLIVLNADQPIELKQSIHINDKSVTLVAPEERPVEFLVRFQNKPAFVTDNARLEIENIKIERFAQELAREDEDAEPLIRCVDGRLSVQHSILYCVSPVAMIELEECNASFFSTGLVSSTNAIHFFSESTRSLKLENSAIIAPVGIFLEDVQETNVTFERTTCVTDAVFGMERMFFPPVEINVTAEKSLFAAQTALVGLESLYEENDELDEEDEHENLDSRKLVSLDSILEVLSATGEDNFLPNILIGVTEDESSAQLATQDTPWMEHLKEQRNGLFSFSDFDFPENLIDLVAEGEFDLGDLNWDQFQAGANPQSMGLLKGDE